MYDVGQLVGEQPLTGGGVGSVVSARNIDVRSVGKGLGSDGSAKLPASVRLLIPLGAELVSELPRLGISALPVAAFELVVSGKFCKSR